MTSTTSVKITAKQFAGYKKAQSSNCISFNDSYNKATFGITKAQHDVIAKCCGEMLGMEHRAVTLAAVNRFLAGEKVHLCYAQDSLLEAARKAFT